MIIKIKDVIVKGVTSVRRTLVRPSTTNGIFSLLVFFAGTFIISVSSQSYAQTLHQGEWKTYTAMSNVTDLAVVRKSGNVWAATTGGAFRFSPTASAKTNIFALRNSDGLSDNNITAVAADSNGRIYFGGESGTLDVYTESTGKIDPIRDIALATQYSRKKIFQITVFGSRVYIATGFGLSIYDTTRNIFSETITQFGTLISQDTVFAVTEANDSIYVVQSGAIAIAAKNAPNLSDPRVWRIVYAGVNTTLSSIISIQGSVIIGGGEGIYKIVGDSLQYIPTGDSISVVRLAVTQNTLYIIDVRGRRIKTSTDLINFLSSPTPVDISGQGISSFAIANTEAKVFGDGFGGGVIVELPDGSSIAKIFPDGPLDNNILDLHYSSNLGKLFVSLRNIGISVFQPQKNQWLGYGTKEGILPQNNYTSTFYDTVLSKLWVSTGGNALYSFDSANPAAIKHYDVTQGIPSFAGNSQGFTVMGKGTLDNRGKFIVTSWAGGEGKGLVKTLDGKQFTAIPLNPPTAPLQFGICVQDLDDIYFVATVEQTSLPPPFGVFVVATDGSTQAIAGGNGQILGSASVNALVVDQDNGLWCGTNIGVDVLTHSRDFTTGRPKFNKPRRLVFTDQQFVKTIAVDGVGNKWVGTDNGVFVLSADGSDSLAHFTTSNSPLIDNSVSTIAIDTKNGEVYIGTPKGISRVSSIYQEGSTDYSKIYVYPNPVIQNSDDNIKVTITGLAGGSTVKIFSASGRLIATIDGSRLGSTVTWNGRDETGKLIPSGVYVAAAASAISTEHGQVKFVLIRK